jgi:hypothetical protein
MPSSENVLVKEEVLGPHRGLALEVSALQLPMIASILRDLVLATLLGLAVQ